MHRVGCQGYRSIAIILIIVCLLIICGVEIYLLIAIIPTRTTTSTSISYPFVNQNNINYQLGDVVKIKNIDKKTFADTNVIFPIL